jgi:hypothetical protein
MFTMWSIQTFFIFGTLRKLSIFFIDLKEVSRIDKIWWISWVKKILVMLVFVETDWAQFNYLY